MDNHTATETAYRNGYAEGFAAAKAAAVPCRIGDMVFALRKNGGRCILKYERVSHMEYDKDMRLIIHVRHTCRGVWGEDVFDNEAAALAQMQKNERGGSWCTATNVRA